MPPSFEKPSSSNQLETKEPWPPSLDRWLEVELDKQYNDFTKALNDVGILHILPESLEMGIIGYDGQEYPLPDKDKIKAKMLENREVIETKMSQGFTRLQLTPFALPLDQLIDITKDRIKKQHQAGQLFTAKQDPDDLNEPLIPLELDEKEPLSCWDKYHQADLTGELRYYPDKFTEEDHGGLTKDEIIKMQTETNDPFQGHDSKWPFQGHDSKWPFQGWEVKLLEDNIHIPAQGNGKTIKDRPRLTANQQPLEYLQTLKTNPVYKNESGLTPEDWLTLFLTHLKQTNQVIDDWDGHGKACFLLGAWFPASGDVGYAYWYQYDQRAFLCGGCPGYQDSYDGARSAVKV